MRKEGAALEASVYDHDNISASDMLGRATVPLHELLQYVSTGTIDLTLEGTKKKKGDKPSILKMTFAYTDAAAAAGGAAAAAAAAAHGAPPSGAPPAHTFTHTYKPGSIGLGFQGAATKENKGNGREPGMIVSSVKAGGQSEAHGDNAADERSKIVPGDRITKVNNVNIEGMVRADALLAIKNAMKNQFTLTFCRSEALVIVDEGKGSQGDKGDKGGKGGGMDGGSTHAGAKASEKMREVFTQLDRDKSGSVNARELLVGLRKHPEMAEYLHLPMHVRQEKRRVEYIISCVSVCVCVCACAKWRGAKDNEPKDWVDVVASGGLGTSDANACASEIISRFVREGVLWGGCSVGRGTRSTSRVGPLEPASCN